MRLRALALVLVAVLAGAFASTLRPGHAQAPLCTFYAQRPANDSLAAPFPDGRVGVGVRLACPAGFTPDAFESVRMYLDGRQIVAHFFCCTGPALDVSNLHDLTVMTAGPHVARIEVRTGGVTYSTEWRFYVRIRPSGGSFRPGFVLATWLEGSGRAVHPQQIVDEIERVAPAPGEPPVDVVSVWLTRDGEFSGYIVGAPAFVNASEGARQSIEENAALLVMLKAEQAPRAPHSEVGNN